MKTKKMKILLVIVILMMTASLYNNTYANNIDIMGKAQNFISLGESSNSDFNTDIATEGFEEIAGLLMGIGIFVAIAVGIILGAKFMFLSAEGKAEVSKLLAPYVVGVIIIVGALVIWKAAIEMLDIF